MTRIGALGRLLATSLAAVAVASCGGSSSGANGGQATPATATVFAASSLTNAFAAEATAFKQKTGGKITFSFAGSQDLVAQIQQGAPADALATADTKTMDAVAKQLHGASQVFARNTLVIVVAPGNPHHIASLADLVNRKLVVVLADPSVPAGKYAVQALQAAKVTVHAKSFEPDVRSVLTKVELGEADAGIAYVTDAKSAGAKVASVPVPNSPIATYPIVSLTKQGDAFVAFVESAAGQAILRQYGFLPP